MKLFEFVRQRQWIPVTGYLIYISALAAGYYYNLTFVQLGLIDLGTRLAGMRSREVSMAMAALALLTLVVAVASGVLMDRRGWSTDLYVKFRLLFCVLAVQLVLTVAAPAVSTPEQFLLWVVVCSTTLGLGIPVTFSFTIDFVPVRDRGYVAAIVAGLSFFVAALYPIEWRIEEFSTVVAVAMAPALLVLGVLSVRRFAVVDVLARQHEQFGTGRFCRPTLAARIATSSPADSLVRRLTRSSLAHSRRSPLTLVRDDRQRAPPQRQCEARDTRR
ncbi:hypothetical protein [Natronorubrum sp. FCH18a]|uniref:hypothetical protein n=1 Tax=Natronorubrum sp. FCH18a TaxID=3447018 RepID=UPI003F510127